MAGDVVRMVVKQSARTASIGVAAGAAMALAIAPVFAHQIEALHPGRCDRVWRGGADCDGWRQ